MPSSAAPRVTLEGDDLIIGSTRVARAKVERIESERRPPRLSSRLSALAIGAGGIPVALVLNAMTEMDLTWLVAFPVAVLLGGGFSLMTSVDRYAVVVVTDAGTLDAYVGLDNARVSQLTSTARALLAPVDRSSQPVANAG